LMLARRLLDEVDIALLVARSAPSIARRETIPHYYDAAVLPHRAISSCVRRADLQDVDAFGESPPRVRAAA
jgi:hypothetical protein